MGPDDRHNDMLHARDPLLEEYRVFKERYFPKGTFPLLEARFKSTSVRSYYAYLISRYIRENTIPTIKSKSELFDKVIPLTVEVIIAIQYYHNQILDAKSGKATLSEAKLNMTSADSLKHHLYQYLRDRNGIEPEERETIFHFTDLMFYCVDIGQFIEKTGTTFDQYQKKECYNTQKIYKKLLKNKNEFIWPESDESIRSQDFQMRLLTKNITQQSSIGHLPRSKKIISDALVLAESMIESDVIRTTRSGFIGKEAFADLYFKKISLTCGALFVLTTRLIMKLMALSETSKEGRALLAFARRFGVMRQIVNDCCDWAPSHFGLNTKAKTAQDALSDLKNRNITLPLLFLLKEETTESTINGFLKGELNEFNEAVVFQEIIASTSLKSAMKTGYGLANEAVFFLTNSNREKSAAWYLKDMAKIADNNNYYHRFYCVINNKNKGP
ncbi:MAG: polyprenyl synthetase family protein [Saprospiraceae bacterium]|nr:polyprenyl synthetase family protein [Saprospiraceae bacterium]